VAVISTASGADVAMPRSDVDAWFCVAPDPVIREIDIYVLGIHARLHLARTGARGLRWRRNSRSARVMPKHRSRL
jgi:hypothetical protein